MGWQIIIMALIGAGIGWFTNYLAIKLIFRPLNPISIPILGIKIQGLVPKRRDEITASIGKIVEEELLGIDDLLIKLNTKENQVIIAKNIRVGILRLLEEKLPALIPSGIRNSILRYAGGVIDKETEKFIKHNMDKLIIETLGSINVRELVEDKLNSFDLLEFESIILSLSKQELKYIEILGGILGLIIGLIQGIILKAFAF